MSATPPDITARKLAAGVPELPDTAHETLQVYVMDKLVRAYRAVLFSEGSWWKCGALGAWVPMREEEIWAEVQALNGLETLEGSSDGKPGKPIRVSAGMCESVAALARARFSEPNAFAGCVRGFITPRGLWTITAAEGWTCRTPTPSDRVRLYIDADPVMNAPPPLWLATLYRMWGHEEDYTERCAFLHEWIGAMLCGDATKYQMAPILVGGGENGKSVVIEVISGLVPDELRCSVTPDDLENNRFASVRLVGKALNCVAEIPGNELLTSAKIKAVIDGSEQSGERKNKDAFDFRPQAGHIFSCNSLPHVRDLSHGFWRRWGPLTCTAPPISESEKRLGLKDEIVTTERAQLLGYAMQYYEQAVMERRGYTAVPSILAARAAWRGDSDNVQQWVEDECLVDGSSTSVGDLYRAYKRYAAETGTKSVSLRTFGARLQALGYPPERSNTERLRAISLRSDVLARAANENRHGYQ